MTTDNDNNAFRFTWTKDDATPLFTIANDGTVTLGEGVTCDEAARAFWRAVAARNPMRPDEVKIDLKLSAEDRLRALHEIAHALKPAIVLCVSMATTDDERMLADLTVKLLDCVETVSALPKADQFAHVNKPQGETS
jgi:chemotaxis response regulator CheB